MPPLDDYGPLTPYLASPDVSEIMVNGPSKIFIEQSGEDYAGGEALHL